MTSHGTEPFVLPPLPEAHAWVQVGDDVELEELTRLRETRERDLSALRARAITHADTGVFTADGIAGTPRDEAGLRAERLASESESLEIFTGSLFYWRVYVRALAHRYLRETGAVDVDRVVWEFDASAFVLPPTSREILHQADGTPVQPWREWLAERLAAGEQHGYAHLLAGLAATAAEAAQLRAQRADAHAAALQRELDAVRARSAYRLGSHAARNLSRSVEARKTAALSALRKGKLSKQEYDAFVADDGTSLKGEELLVAALLLEYARQEGQLHNIPAATYKMGALTLDLRFSVSAVSIAQIARDLGAELDDRGRPEKEFCDAIGRVLESLKTERLVLVEPYEVTRHAETGKTRRTAGDVYLETVALVSEIVNPDGERRWRIHPALALGFHHTAVYLDRAAWKRGQKAIGARYLREEMTRGDVYFRLLAPSVYHENLRVKEAFTRESGAPKRLRLSTLVDRLGLEADTVRGQTYLAKRIEKVLEFAVGTGALVAWARWEGAPRRKGGAPELKGYTVRVPVPMGSEEAEAGRTEDTPLFPELEAPMLAAGGV